jgi:hypothetical protein
MKKVKLDKIGNWKWNVVADGEVVGTCRSINYSNEYKVELNNGIVIKAFNQKTVKRMVSENI